MSPTPEARPRYESPEARRARRAERTPEQRAADAAKAADRRACMTDEQRAADNERRRTKRAARSLDERDVAALARASIDARYRDAKRKPETAAKRAARLESQRIDAAARRVRAKVAAGQPVLTRDEYLAQARAQATSARQHRIIDQLVNAKARREQMALRRVAREQALADREARRAAESEARRTAREAREAAKIAERSKRAQEAAVRAALRGWGKGELQAIVRTQAADATLPVDPARYPVAWQILGCWHPTARPVEQPDWYALDAERSPS